MIKTQPSENSQKILESLKSTAIKTLETKHKLGQYVVVWKNNQICLEGQDTPLCNKVK
ncbi:hypothetical protein [Alkalimarinus alittae]|uniref:Uncharacterized protein n=1 Tax=Alkalimarinus alittae TaxID=2961619 RepID=A0ABY6MZC3_9ALTE|nr:hypothetical protein [Alkalimarinus alittae]UZE95169.1 hypothetical protein NKI27_14000 [Alkalimarinus alittae]